MSRRLHAQVELAAQMADRVIASGASFCLIGDVRTIVCKHPCDGARVMPAM